ncbi:MAG: FtsX-like permease family protein [Chloroflexota bacterium]|nr:FtsX-like permease family protein [Chloroflexota bacterium]
MRAVGWRRRDVVGQLVAEALGQSALGGLVGLGLAALATWGLSFTKVSIPVPWELSPSPHFLPGGATSLAVTVGLDT